MTHVLVAYDGSDPAQDALEFAQTAFEPDRLTVLYVFDPSEAGYGAPDPFASDRGVEELAAERADELLPAATATVAESIPVQTTHTVGHPAREIVATAEREAVDHVVIGSHGREGVSRLLVGSVAETVVRRSPVPVTTVR